MSKELKNSSGEVREVTLEPSGERGLEEGLAMTCSDGSYKEGANDDDYTFGAVDFSKGGAKIGTMSAAVNERGIIRFEGMSEGGNMDLTIDLTKLDAEGKGKILGHINGNPVNEKIDPNGTEDAERGWFSKLVGGGLKVAGGIVGGIYGGPIGAKIGSMAAGYVAGRVGLREMTATEVKFEANRGFMDIVKPLGKNLLSTALSVGHKWWNDNVKPDSVLGQVGNAALGVLSQRLER